MPQPYLVPVRPTCSLITHSKGVSASAETSLTVPLILSFAICILPIRRAEHNGGRNSRLQLSRTDQPSEWGYGVFGGTRNFVGSDFALQRATKLNPANGGAVAPRGVSQNTI